MTFDEPHAADGWAPGPEDAEHGGALYEIGRTICAHLGPSLVLPALLNSFVCDIAERTAEVADPRALEAARAFHPHERLHLHALLASDRTGRLRQLATVAPGLVHVMTSGNAARAVQRVMEGERLNVVVT